MKRIVSTVLAAALVLSLAACSNGETGTSEADNSSEAPASATTEGAETESDGEESDLAYIQDKGTMIIGYTVYAPMNYTDDEAVSYTHLFVPISKDMVPERSILREFIG